MATGDTPPRIPSRDRRKTRRGGILTFQTETAKAWPARSSQAATSTKSTAGNPTIMLRKSGRQQSAGRRGVQRPDAGGGPAGRGREAQVLAWQWALANQSGDGSLPSGRDIGREHGRHERWGRL